jgi:isopenicillin-N N-acyltransferase like protein
VELVKLSGTPYERGEMLGRRFGATLRETVAKNEQSLREILAAKGLATLSDDRYRAMVQRGIPYAEEYAPELMQEVRGMADGAGLPFEAVFGLNYFLDFFDATYPQLSNDLIFGCTALAATGSATSDDGAYIGQNYDLRRLYQDGCVLLQMEVAPGVEALVYTVVGLVGCAGMNGAGVGIVINNLTPTDSRPGVPYTFVLRRALAQARLSEAMNTICAAHRASGINYLMADRNGEIMSVETSAADADVLYALDGYIAHSNNYVHPRMVYYDAPSRAYNGDSYYRWGRATKLLKQRQGHLDAHELMQILGDHSGYPFSICRHPLPGLSELRTGNTVASLLMDLRASKMWISTANPCEHAYEEFTLAPMVGAAQAAGVVTPA